MLNALACFLLKSFGTHDLRLESRHFDDNFMNKELMFSRYAKPVLWIALATIAFSACENNAVQPNTQPVNAPVANTATVAASPAASPAAATNNAAAAAALPVTLPVLDAMFADENFAGELKSKLSLTDEQIERLKTTASEARAGLEENENGSTNQATSRAQTEIRNILGEDKSKQLAAFVSERWQGGTDAAGGAAATNDSKNANSVPTDTRIVVNAPAYRMDVFKDGQLLRSYKVGIGYPEFPLPTGTRRADTLIYNPTWTPPDEPWVKGKIKAGEKIAAGDKLNPLGPIKIPIGSPSLIHGGKNPARLGSFASHGCVGLTNDQVQEVAQIFAQLTETALTAEDIAGYQKNKTETKNVKLKQPLPIELRYETIVAEDGKLHIYRDVYERGTNTEENARLVLQANGISFESLSEQERGQIATALKQMARDAEGNAADPSTAAQPMSQSNGNNKAAAQNGNANAKVKETKTVKGNKEVVIELAALKGKGYPAPVDLNTGAKSKKPLNLSSGNTAQNPAANNANGNSNKAATANGNSSGRRF